VHHTVLTWTTDLKIRQFQQEKKPQLLLSPLSDLPLAYSFCSAPPGCGISGPLQSLWEPSFKRTTSSGMFFF